MLFPYGLDKEIFEANKENDEDVDYCFYRFDKIEFSNSRTNEQDDETISKWVEKAYKHCLKGETFYRVASGNTIVIGLSFKDEIQIIIAKNYDEYTVNLD